MKRKLLIAALLAAMAQGAAAQHDPITGAPIGGGGEEEPVPATGAPATATAMAEGNGGAGGAAVQDQVAQGGSVILEGSTDNSVYTSSSKYDMPAAPVHSAVAPDVGPTAPCLIPSSGAVQTHIIGLSGSAYRMDEECNAREWERTRMATAATLKAHGMEALARRVLLNLRAVKETMEEDGLAVYKGSVYEKEQLEKFGILEPKRKDSASLYYQGSKRSVKEAYPFSPADGG